MGLVNIRPGINLIDAAHAIRNHAVSVENIRTGGSGLSAQDEAAKTYHSANRWSVDQEIRAPHVRQRRSNIQRDRKTNRDRPELMGKSSLRQSIMGKEGHQ